MLVSVKQISIERKTVVSQYRRIMTPVLICSGTSFYSSPQLQQTSTNLLSLMGGTSSSTIVYSHQGLKTYLRRLALTQVSTVVIHSAVVEPLFYFLLVDLN